MKEIRAEAGNGGIAILEGERRIGTYPASTRFAFDGTTLVAFSPDRCVWFVDLVTGKIRMVEDDEEQRFALSMWQTAPLHSLPAQ